VGNGAIADVDQEITPQVLEKNNASAHYRNRKRLIGWRQKGGKKVKKIGLFIIGAIAAVTLFANLGSLAVLAVSLVILYYAWKRWVKAETTMKKLFWIAIGIIAFVASASNAPALIAVAAAYVLYVVCKKWNETKQAKPKEIDDPFAHFEKQWAELERSF
jgi:lia operon protein LiaI